MLALIFGDRWEVYLSQGQQNLYYQYPEQRTKTRLGAHAIARRLNRSNYAKLGGLVFKVRRRGAL